MNKILCLVLMLVMAVAPCYGQDEELSPSEKRQELKYARQTAEAWVKDEMALRKKVIAQLRKIKDERSAEKSAKVICKLLETGVSGEQTALGEVGEATRPTGEAIEAEDKKREPVVSKQKKQIAAELKRISALELDVPEWATAQMLVESMP